MITLLGALLGFLGSAFPEFIRIFRDSKDRAHELAMMDRQIEFMKLQTNQRLEEIQMGAEAQAAKFMYRHAAPTGVAWVDALAGTVRPVITYSFFCLYAGVKTSQWMVLQNLRLSADEALVQLWNIEDQTLFATVISFWFGQRLLMKARQDK